MSIKREMAAILCAMLVLASALEFASHTLMPLRKRYGCGWDAYLQEPENSIDLIAVGNSMVYCNIIPGIIYGKTNIRSYVVSGPELSLPLSYYYIRQACKTQQPQAIALELSEMFFPTFRSYSLVNVSYMPLGLNRIGAAINGSEPEIRRELLLPILSYHSRWPELKNSEFKQHFENTLDILAGYTMITEANEQKNTYIRECSADETDYATSIKYLEKIYEYCSRRDIELILYMSPAMGRVSGGDMDKLRNDLNIRGLPQVHDFNDRFEELELDASTDWYDSLHLNYSGAVKFSADFGRFLLEMGIEPTCDGTDRLWQQRAENINQANDDNR